MRSRSIGPYRDRKSGRRTRRWKQPPLPRRTLRIERTSSAPPEASKLSQRNRRSASDQTLLARASSPLQPSKGLPGGAILTPATPGLFTALSTGAASAEAARRRHLPLGSSRIEFCNFPKGHRAPTRPQTVRPEPELQTLLARCKVVVPAFKE